MRLSSIIYIAVAATPLAVSATGRLAYAIGAKKPGIDLLTAVHDRCAYRLIFHVDGTCKYTADYEADFDTLQIGLVRTYSSNDCNTAEQILPAAKNKGIQVMLGVWSVSPNAHVFPPPYVLSAKF